MRPLVINNAFDYRGKKMRRKDEEANFDNFFLMWVSSYWKEVFRD